jgi:phosphopantetheine adenylyltransferase
MAVAQANAMMAPDIQTVFLPTEPGQSFVSSSVVKEMASLARDNTIDAVRRALGRFVAPNVAEALLAKRKAV